VTEPREPSAERTQLDKLGDYIFENVPGAPLRAYGIAEQAIEVIAAQRRAITDLAIAIQLTVEYVGYDTLPPSPAWSWFDALAKHAPELLDSMRASMPGRIDVAPHDFQRLSRWLHRHKCARCYLPPEGHPTSSYAPARPLGDYSDDLDMRRRKP
jgi:hypothetical protein